MYTTIWYKYYEGSNRASLILAYGTLLKVISYIYALIMLFVNWSYISESNEDLKTIIILVTIEVLIGALIYITGRIVKNYSKVYAAQQIESKASKSFEFAKRMADFDPEKNKEWMMAVNDEYYEYVRSGREEMDKRLNTDVNPAKGTAKHAFLGCLVIVAFFTLFILFINW